MLSLLIAAQQKGVQAVVAYYPLADFEEWLDISRYPFPKTFYQSCETPLFYSIDYLSAIEYT